MQVRKRELKLSKKKFNINFDDIYYAYLDKRIEMNLKAIKEGKIYTFEEVRRMVETWK